MRIVVELHIDPLELAAALDVHRVRPVHQDVRNRWIAEQRFEWPMSEHLVLDAADDELALRQAERGILLTQQPLCDLTNLHASFTLVDRSDQREVENGQQ